MRQTFTVQAKAVEKIVNAAHGIQPAHLYAAVNLDPSVLLRRRDQLIERVHAAYDQIFPAEQRAFESVRLNGNGALTDETIDRWLPESLRRSTRAA